MTLQVPGNRNLLFPDSSVLVVSLCPCHFPSCSSEGRIRLSLAFQTEPSCKMRRAKLSRRPILRFGVRCVVNVSSGMCFRVQVTVLRCCPCRPPSGENGPFSSSDVGGWTARACPALTTSPGEPPACSCVL